eukprot:6181186-Pleurochrysis_carterae.AAC.3
MVRKRKNNEAAGPLFTGLVQSTPITSSCLADADKAVGNHAAPIDAVLAGGADGEADDETGIEVVADGAGYDTFIDGTGNGNAVAAATDGHTIDGAGAGITADGTGWGWRLMRQRRWSWPWQRR